MLDRLSTWLGVDQHHDETRLSRWRKPPRTYFRSARSSARSPTR
jgi:hypothetical protein